MKCKEKNRHCALTKEERSNALKGAVMLTKRIVNNDWKEASSSVSSVGDILNGLSAL
jgi:hypothetical protein